MLIKLWRHKNTILLPSKVSTSYWASILSDTQHFQNQIKSINAFEYLKENTQRKVELWRIQKNHGNYSELSPLISLKYSINHIHRNQFQNLFLAVSNFTFANFIIFQVTRPRKLHNLHFSSLNSQSEVVSYYMSSPELFFQILQIARPQAHMVSQRVFLF